MMKIAITHPTDWPRVYRGTERFMNELASFLSGRGHAVTILSQHAGPKKVDRRGRHRAVYLRRLWHPLLERAGVREIYPFVLPCTVALLGERYDVVHCCSFADATAASLARTVTGTPFVLWVNGVPQPDRSPRRFRPGLALFRRAMGKADRVIVLSRFLEGFVEGFCANPPVRIPVPVDLERFRLSRDRDHERPVILCAAALGDRWKGGRALMLAFNRVKEVHPLARLHVARGLDEARKGPLLSLVDPRWRDDVSFLGEELSDSLPDLYGRAAISVLPSLQEPFGMVVPESLATGTPVVGSRSGAIPENLSDPAVGRLFDPEPVGGEPTNAEGLAGAMIEALDLSRSSETAERCRTHVEKLGWQTLGPEFESLYREVIAARAARSPGRSST